MYRVLALLLLFFQATAYGAKAGDAMFIEYQYSPPTLKKDSGDEPVSNTHLAKAQFGLPLYISKESRPFFVGLNISYKTLDTHIQLDEFDDHMSFHAIGTAITAYVPINKDLSIVTSLGSSLNTNLDYPSKIDQGDLNTISTLMFINNKGNYSYSYGVATTSSFGRPMVAPVLAFSIKPVSWYEFTLVLPSEISNWFYYKDTSFGIFSKVSGEQYRLNRKGEGDNYTVGSTQVELGLACRYRVWDNIYLYGEGGIYPYRVETINRDDNRELRKVTYDDAIVNGGFIRFGLAYAVK